MSVMAFKWKVTIVFFEKLPDGKRGKMVANSKTFEITTAVDDTKLARDEADRLYNADPQLQGTPDYNPDGDYIRYANIEHAD